MKAKYAGTCKKTGRKFRKGDNIKWLGRGKGAELISYADDHKPSGHCNGWDGQSPYNDAGEPMMTATQYRQACQADDEFHYYDR
tara:strand:- start:2873 stop:3124 length:252 start_codon:yes stop_codon:yes gene_type:complete